MDITKKNDIFNNMYVTGHNSGNLTCLVTGISNGNTDSSEFEYREDLTHTIEEVYPRRGGTGGGTDITITGKRFG